MKKFVLAVSLALLAACTKPAYITLTSPTTVNVGASGENITVKFSTNRDWVASTATGWATVSSRTGSPGDVDLTVRITPSYETDSRSVDLILTAEDAKASVRIVQSAPPVIEMDKTSYAIGSNGGYLDLGLRSNVAFSASVTEGSDWLRVISTKGLTSHTAEVAVDPNKTSSPRTAKVQFTGGVSPVEVTVTQDGREQIFRVRHQAGQFTFPLLGGELVEGIVDWDYLGRQNAYASGLEFSYPDVTQRTAVFTGRNVTEVTLPSLSDITGLDFSRL